MRSMLGWCCEDCGTGKTYMCGGGFMSFNESEVVELSKGGALGPAMRALLGDGIPEGWTVFRQNAFYECPGCGDVIWGGTIRIDDKGGGWLVYHAEPDPCPTCGEELVFWDDKVPMSERVLMDKCSKIVEQGCPECGGKGVS